MIKPNWDLFRAKFSENPQKNFEWFCYLLFCKEFNRPFGIFCYLNQSAIETNPIYVGDQVISWQAKFYNTTLSRCKNEILDLIKKAKRDYPNLTKIIFYTNQEWAQNRGRNPKGLDEIETKAKESTINIEWRTTSFFNSEFVTLQNEQLSEYFFSYEKGVIDVIKEQQIHTKNILNDSKTCIPFREKHIEIDRSKSLHDLLDIQNRILVVSGVGGVGKTALIRKYYEQIESAKPFFVFKATEFELRNINDFFRDCTIYEFLNIFKDEEEKIITIDSCEKLLDLKNSDPFKEFLSELIKFNWKIIFTVRENYLDNLN